MNARPNRQTVVLNASFEPLGVVPLHRAMMHLVREKAVIVEAVPGEVYRSATDEFEIPLVIQLRKMVRVPYNSHTETWTRRGVLERDNFACAFCDKRRATTVDHIMPTSRGGGRRDWMNTVAACSPCNNRKDDKTPEEAGMPLRFQPREVTVRASLLVAIASTGANMAMLGLA
jgi:5-methylcytosine-specific restriction endonuclease McrA